MRKVLNYLKKQWITVWLVVVTALLAIGVIYAAYLGNTEVKRVVSTASISNIFFSSNMLDASTDGVVKIMKSSDTTKDYQCLVSIFNYDEMMPTNFAKEDISYNLTAELVQIDEYGNFNTVTSVVKTTDDSANKVFTIQKVKDNNTSVSDSTYDLNADSFSKVYTGETLTGGAAHANTYRLTIDKEEVEKDSPNFYIHIVATPTTDNVSGTVLTQSGYVSVAKGTVYNSGWSGALSERSTTKNYDAYNMIVSGSGTGTIDIKWDNTKFEINEVFLEKYAYDSTTGTGIDSGGITTSGSTSKITLHVDSVVLNRYEIQFYKITQGDYELATVKSAIVCNN